MVIRNRPGFVITYTLVIFWGCVLSIKNRTLISQLPLMSLELPETLELNMDTMLIYGLGNVVLIPYAAYCNLVKHPVGEHSLIYINMSIGACCCCLMAFIWNKTTMISGHLHSLGFFVIVSGFAIADNLASVLHLKYIRGFKPKYMSGYYVGVGLGGLVPSSLGLIQGPPRNPLCGNISKSFEDQRTGITFEEHELTLFYDQPRISVQWMFLIAFGMLCISGAAFGVLQNAEICKGERMTSYQDEESTEDSTSATPILNGYVTKERTINLNHDAVCDKKVETFVSKKFQMSSVEHMLLLFLVFWSTCFLNGIRICVLAYACLPYGYLIYSLSVNLSILVCPLVSFLAIFGAVESFVALGGLTLAGTVLLWFQLYIAVMSPSPPLQHEAIGGVIMVITTIISTTLLTYVGCCLSMKAQTSSSNNTIFWFDLLTRMGPLAGSVSIFILRYICGVFTSIHPCDFLSFDYKSV